MTGADIISIAIVLFAIADGSLFTGVHISALSTADNQGFAVLTGLTDLNTRVTRLDERNH